MEERNDETGREITFSVDSAACRSVVPSHHKACRGYKTWKDEHHGCKYGTAKAGGARITDEGLRVLQTKGDAMDLPMRLSTRRADVSKPLLAVCDMVDRDHAVLFDSSGSYAVNKTTGRKTQFARVGRGWDLKLMLEAPEKANKVMAEVIAALEEKVEAKAPGVQLMLRSQTDDSFETTPFRLAALPFRR